MLKIDYPVHPFRIREEDSKEIIFDEFRKQWVRLTPEEWVRQNFLQYLVKIMKYPAALIAIEKEMQLGELRKRFDILVYDSDHRPWMMVECKSMQVPLNKKVLEQVLRYNIAIPVSYLVITNGKLVAVFQRNESGLVSMSGLPSVT